MHVGVWRVHTPWYAIALLFAGSFERPSFGNGEVPLWSVAVCVSGRFNNSRHRTNFHFWGEPGLKLFVCIFCQRVRPKPPCLRWCMQKSVLVHNKVWSLLCRMLPCFVLPLSLSMVLLFVLVGRCWWNIEWQRVWFSVACLANVCNIVPSRMTAIFNPFSEA